jgi:hypothetical protein
MSGPPVMNEDGSETATTMQMRLMKRLKLSNVLIANMMEKQIT